MGGHEKPTDGLLRIDGVTLREYRERLEHQPAATAASPPASLPAELPAVADAFKQHDPPWSHLDPDNPEYEEFRNKRACEGAVASKPSDSLEGGSSPTDPVARLLCFFQENGKRFRGLQRSVWNEEARAAGIKFSESAFDTAWRIAKAKGLIIPAPRGAPKKAEQAKRRHQQSARRSNLKG